MKSYSPYDNVAAKDYPALLVTGGLNDPRVQYWEPAKWVAKLRATKTDDRLLVLKTEMGAGHSGPSGRYDAWQDEAFVLAFVLDQLGIDALIRRGRRARTDASGRARRPGHCAFATRGATEAVQTGRTFCASSPFRPGATSNSTRWPSSRVL